jgi:hypothetical protein
MDGNGPGYPGYPGYPGSHVASCRAVVSNAYPAGSENISHTNKTTLRNSSGPHRTEVLTCRTQAVISLTGQNRINNSSYIQPYSFASQNIFVSSLTIVVYVRFEVFTAVTMGNAVFWDIETQFVPHRNITSPLQSPAG